MVDILDQLGVRPTLKRPQDQAKAPAPVPPKTVQVAPAPQPVRQATPESKPAPAAPSVAPPPVRPAVVQDPATEIAPTANQSTARPAQEPAAAQDAVVSGVAHPSGRTVSEYLRKRPQARPFADALVAMGVKEQHIALAQEYVKRTDVTLVEAMRRLGLVSMEIVAQALAESKERYYARPEIVDAIDQQNLLIVTKDRAFSRDDVTYVPIYAEQDGPKQRWWIAVANETAFSDAKNFAFTRGAAAEIVIASETTIQKIYRRYFANTEANFDETVERVIANSSSTPLLLQALITHACFSGASDIHLTALPDAGLIRLRHDGVLRKFRVLRQEHFNGIINLLAQDSHNRDPSSPADGSIADDKVPAALRGRYRFRIALTTTVSQTREAIIRIIDQEGGSSDFDSLQFDAKAAHTLKRYINNPTGLLLITGPTGSGKTTTVYALLKEIDPLAVSLQTIEKPVEYRSALWRQHEIRSAVAGEEGEAWQTILKSLLRCDPDIMLLGEIRGADTAEVMIESANTGHMVITTLHTKTAADAISRLRTMRHVNGSLISMDALASVLMGILAQRLVRKLCVFCRERDDRPDTQGVIDSHQILKKEATLYRAKPGGCANCGGVGYRGRRMVYELLTMNTELRSMIAMGEPTVKIMAHLPTTDRMWFQALKLVSQGITSIDEIRRSVEEV